MQKAKELLHFKTKEVASLNRIIRTIHSMGRVDLKNNPKRQAIIFQDFQERAILKPYKTFQVFKTTKKERS